MIPCGFFHSMLHGLSWYRFWGRVVDRTVPCHCFFFFFSGCWESQELLSCRTVAQCIRATPGLLYRATPVCKRALSTYSHLLLLLRKREENRKTPLSLSLSLSFKLLIRFSTHNRCTFSSSPAMKESTALWENFPRTRIFTSILVHAVPPISFFIYPCIQRNS